MGYTTEFDGHFDLDRPMTEAQATYLNRFCQTLRLKRDPVKAATLPDPIRVAAGLPIGVDGEYFVGGTGYRGQGDDVSIIDYNAPPSTQPGLWCQWKVSGDRRQIAWDGVENFYEYTAWLTYICNHFLIRWGYKLNGQVTWQGEEDSDSGTLNVVDNTVHADAAWERTR